MMPQPIGWSFFGGGDATAFFNDVWLLDNANGAGAGVSAWCQILPTGAAPDPRYLFSRYERMMEHRKGCLSSEGWGVLPAPLPSMTLGC